MFALKLIVGVLSIVFSCKIGVDKAYKHKKTYYFFESANMFCNAFLSDLLYKRSNLKEIIKIKYTSIEFEDSIKNFVINSKINLPNFLSLEEKTLFEGFLNSLGKYDTDSQIKIVEGYRDSFLKISNEKFLTFKKFYTLFIKLGFIFGLTIFILVI